MLRRYRQASHGFTLLEALVVITILVVLAALVLPLMSRAAMSANSVKCTSNLRQIGTAMLLYATDNAGVLPASTHSARVAESWIYEIADYLDDVDQVRVCPADPAKRKKRIIEQKGTSYALNDLVFDDAIYYQIHRIPFRSRTLLAFILSEDRPPSRTNDHIHGDQWSAWKFALNDVEVDRHRNGARAQDRLKGSANYLFADGHVENIPASSFKDFFDRGINPAAVPTEP